MLHKFRNTVKKINTNDKKVNVTIGGLEGIVHLKMKILLNYVYICIMNNISNVFVCLMEVDEVQNNIGRNILSLHGQKKH